MLSHAKTIVVGLGLLLSYIIPLTAAVKHKASKIKFNLFLAQVFLVTNFLSAHIVTFDLGSEGTLLSGDLVQNVVSGGTAIAPEFSVTAGYAFVGWNTDFQNVTGDLTVTAQYADPTLAEILESKFTAGDGAAYDRFGKNVSISGDTAIVGAQWDDDLGSKSGSAYVYVRSDGVWTEQAKLNASDGAAEDQFGHVVSISGDTAVVGAFGDDDLGSQSGSAYVYVRSGEVWTEQAKLTASDGAGSDRFSFSVSVSGDTIVVGAYQDDDLGGNSGSAYVYVRSGEVWTEQAKLTAGDGARGDRFGFNLSVSGDTAVVGAYQDDDLGSKSGSAYVYVRSGEVWTEQAKLTASDGAADDRLGFSVSVSGDTAAVGAYFDDDSGSKSGSVYVFVRNGVIWTEQAKLTASDGAADDQFGRKVSISGDTVVVGSQYDDDSGNSSGSAYVFVRNGVVWTEQSKLIAYDGAASDLFGWDVGISGDTAIVGSYGDDDLGNSSGSMYIYDLAVAPANEPPVSVADTAITNEDVAVMIDVLSNDSDVNPSDSLSIASVADETNGTVVINSDNTVIFTPTANFNGTASFTYIAQDNNSALSASTSVMITVNPINDQPVAEDAHFLIDQGTTLSSTLSGSDVDGDTITFSLVDEPSSGNAVVNPDGSFTYTPDPAFAGEVTFTYRVNDGSLDSVVATVTIDSTLAEILESKLTASDGAAYDNFGKSVSVSGDIALVGADKDDINGTDSGSAYAFVRNNGVWTEESKLIPGDGALEDGFGYSVSVSGDTALVGAYMDDHSGVDSGSVYVFVRNNGVWTEQAKLIASAVASGDRFGWSVSLYGDTALVGAFAEEGSRGGVRYRGSAYVFVRNNGVWTEQSNLLTLVDNEESSDGFGISVSVSSDTALVGVPHDDDNGTNSGIGSAYVFVRNNGAWTKQSKLTASDGAIDGLGLFGRSVSVSADLWT